MNQSPQVNTDGPRISKIRQIVKKNWDEIGIATALGLCAADASNRPPVYVMEAIRRSSTVLHDATDEEIRDYIASLDDEQIPGFVNNVKGIAHEIYFVEAENADGDTIHAYIFEDTNHPDYDVVMYNEATGESWELQLKATDDIDYVEDAVEELGADHVVVTDELADEMGLQSSGITNEQVEHDVEGTVDTLLDDRSLWDYVPGLTVWSISLVVVELLKRYRRGEISRRKLLAMLTVFTGAKAAKMIIITGLLLIPGVNVVTGTVLLAKSISSTIETYRSP